MIYGYLTKNRSLERFALLVLLLIAAMVIPVYLSGEAAEDIVEKLPGVTHEAVEKHEDAGFYAMVMTLIAGVSALISLIPKWSDQGRRRGILVTILIALVAQLSLVVTASHGGKIRHPEVSSEQSSPAAPEEPER